MGAPPTAPPAGATLGLTGFVPITPREVVGYSLSSLGPPVALYVRLDDALTIQVNNSAAGITVMITLRMLLVTGELKVMAYPLIPTSNRAAFLATFQLAEGFVLSASANIFTGIVRRGQCYVQVSISRNIAGTVIGIMHLLQGYLTSIAGVPWPLPAREDSVAGPGMLRSITGTAPAAGAEINETVPTGARWRLRSARFSLTTSAAVATRITTLILDDGVNTLVNTGTSTSQLASTTAAYSAAHFGAGAPAQGGDATVNLPPDIMLLAGFRFRTSTNNLQVGDTYTAPQYEVEEWMET